MKIIRSNEEVGFPDSILAGTYTIILSLTTIILRMVPIAFVLGLELGRAQRKPSLGSGSSQILVHVFLVLFDTRLAVGIDAQQSALNDGRNH